MIVKAIGIVKNIQKQTVGANFHNFSGHRGFYMTTQALKKIRQQNGRVTNAVIDTQGYIRAKNGYKLPVFIRTDTNKFLVNADSINSIPKVDLVKDTIINKIIHERRKALLMASRDVNEHNEVIVTIFLDNISRSEFWFGTEHGVEMTKPVIYAVKNSRKNSVFVIHNHPNNSQLSLKDLRQLSANDAVLGAEAIGNAGGLYRVIKTNTYNKNLLVKYIELAKENEKFNKQILDLIIQNSIKIGIKFEFFS